jgi:hypothetical protein
MKRAIGLIAATLLSTSVYSQDYSSSGANPDSTPDYRSRQSEAGSPATSESSSSSSAGYDKAPGLSGGNSSTGQSDGTNVGSTPDSDQSLTTRDSDLNGSEYRGTLESEPHRSFSSELETSGELKGSGTADGAFHEPAAPVREGSQSEGWSTSGTFSGAGPGSVSGSTSSAESSTSSIPSPTESSSSFSADVSNNSALSNRDQELSNRGLEPDSEELSRTDAFSNRVEGDVNHDDVMIFEDWTIVEPDAESSVGAPAESEFGTGSSSDVDNRDRLEATLSGSISGSDSYSQELYERVQRDWSARTGTTDVPATPGLMDRSLEELGQLEVSDDAVGAPGASVSGSAKSADHDAECDPHKGSAAEYEQGFNEHNLDESSSSYHINRGDDEKYHINRSESNTSAPGEYGDRPDRSNLDDGHLNGNNAAGSSGSSESSTSNSSDESSKSTDGAVNQPDL